MPAVSTAQRRFMAMCEHDPAHVKGQCPDMPKEKLREFSRTPEKGLPAHVRPKVPTLLEALRRR